MDLKSFQNDMWNVLRYLKGYYSPRGHARRSRVTSGVIFHCERARETVLRYLWSHFSLQEGT